MRTVTVHIKKIEVVEYTPAEKQATIDVYFNNFKTTKKVGLVDPEAFTDELLKEIRQKLKQKYQSSWGDSPTEGYVTVWIDDEEETEKRIRFFIAKVTDKISEIKNMKSAGDYMHKLNMLKSLKVTLSEKKEGDGFISEMD